MTNDEARMTNRVMNDKRRFTFGRGARAFVVGVWALGIVASFGLGDAKLNAQSNGDRYTFREEHSRDGIGKFYMGREIAHVMGHQAADWLERPERAEEEGTDLLIQRLP